MSVLSVSERARVAVRRLAGNETPEQIATGWTCKKRDGSTGTFDPQKIRTALSKCFKSTGEASDGSIERITLAVVRSLLAHRNTSPEVEEIQRLVIQQLWVDGLFDSAEHYQNYREERRRTREENRISPEQLAAIQEDAKHFTSPLQYFQFLDKYARWNEEKKRRETWSECCDRVLAFFRKQPQLAAIRDDEWDTLYESMYVRETSPAMRVVQMAGPPLDRCNTGAFNCCYTGCDSGRVFSEALYLLMQGCGVGFSVESEYIEKLPRVQRQKGGPAYTFSIPDSTEGWCDAVAFGVNTWMRGDDVDFGYGLIRPYGARLKTKSGRASGPEPLKELLTFIRKKILARQGKYLTTKDCHDILCVAGKIVQVGGVRRASEISLSDLDDTEIRDAKSGNWWDTQPWLDMANNSAVYEEKPDAVTFMQEWLALAKSGSGERGIFNRGGLARQIPERRALHKFGVNPCGEVLLRSKQMCNLSIAVARANDTPESLKRKVILATIWGTLQSTLTNFKYVSPEWKQNCDEERLLGVDITGQMDCPILRPGAPGREALLDDLKYTVLKTNAMLAARLEIPVSAATTVVKPSGNSAAFFGCSSGLHARWSVYQVRRVRISRYGPLAMLLQAEGVPCAIDPANDTLLVFDFLPDPAPAGTPCRNDMTAVEQLQNWLVWKEHWTEHNPSCTIYVGPDEWLELGHEVYKHFDRIGGITFLPKDGGTYPLAPHEELTEADYMKRKAAFPNIRWERLALFEEDDQTTVSSEIACSGGVCERI